MTPDVMLFLSYAREDQERVSRLYDDLLGQGFSPWMDSRNLLPGEIWERRIRVAIRESDYFLACLSRQAVDKDGFVQAEMKQALRLWEEKPEGSIYVIPVKLDDCLLPESLSRFQYADLLNAEGFPRLVRAIRQGIDMKRVALEIYERPAPPTVPSFLSKESPAHEVKLSLLEQHQLDHDYLPRLRQGLLEQLAWEERLVHRVLLFIREVSANAFEHGCSGDTEAIVTIGVSIESVGGNSERAVITIVSPGEGFDVSQRVAEEEARSIDEVGSLGLMMAKRAVDRFTASKDGKTIQGIVERYLVRVTITRSAVLVDDIPIAMVSPAGRIDGPGAAEAFQELLFREVLGQFETASARTGVIIDLQDVEYIGSMGLRPLLLVARTLVRSVGRRGREARAKNPVVLYRPSPLVRETFELAHFNLLFAICDTEDECRSRIREYLVDASAPGEEG